jgi:hypothetical protein
VRAGRGIGSGASTPQPLTAAHTHAAGGHLDPTVVKGTVVQDGSPGDKVQPPAGTPGRGAALTARRSSIALARCRMSRGHGSSRPTVGHARCMRISGSRG